MKARPTRREVLGGAGVVAAAGAAFAVGGCSPNAPLRAAGAGPAVAATVPFYGAHQAGILTPPQQRLVFASFDLTSNDRAALRELLVRWTAAAARLTAGDPVGAVEPADPLLPPADTGEASGLAASRLTVTTGLGRSVFVDGHGGDRLGLARLLPPPLADLPAFGGGEHLDPARSGGDLALQCCADDATVAFHAFHNLTRIAREFAEVRWVQLGFGPAAATGREVTPRNLQGFKDGTNNLDSADGALMRDHVWAAATDTPSWMAGGSYAVIRRIRMRLERWDRASLADQERTIGRKKLSGAPIGSVDEHDAPALDASTPDGEPVIANRAHIRLAAPVTNDGVRILRRGYSFGDGIDPVTGELDAGLFFIAFQRDPRHQFVPLQQRLARLDALNEYIEHRASAVFAVLPGVGRAGDFLGQNLFA